MMSPMPPIVSAAVPTPTPTATPAQPAGAAADPSGTMPLATTGSDAAKSTLGTLMAETFGELRRVEGFNAEDSEALADAAAKYLGGEVSVYDHVLGPNQRPAEVLLPAHLRRSATETWGEPPLPRVFVKRALDPHHPWPWRFAVEHGKSPVAQFVWKGLLNSYLRGLLEKYYKEVIDQPYTTVGRLALSHQIDVSGQGWVWGAWGATAVSAITLGALALFAANNWVPAGVVAVGVFGLGAMASLGLTFRNRIKGAKIFAKKQAEQIHTAQKIRSVIENAHASIELLNRTPDLMVGFMRSPNRGLVPVFTKIRDDLKAAAAVLVDEISDAETAVRDPEIVAEAVTEDDSSNSILEIFREDLEEKQRMLEMINRLVAVFNNAIEKAPMLANALEADLSAKQKVLRALGRVTNQDRAAELAAKKRQQMIDSAKKLLLGFGIMLRDAMAYGEAEHEVGLTGGVRRPVTVGSGELLEAPVEQPQAKATKPAAKATSGPTAAQKAAAAAQGRVGQG